MNNYTLYTKHNGKYRKWGTTAFGDAMCLPHGLWLVTESPGSHSVENIVYKLDHDEYVQPKIVMQRSKVKELIVEEMLDSSGKSINDIADIIARKLLPMEKPTLDLRRKD